jgi:hypothetical protein
VEGFEAALDRARTGEIERFRDDDRARRPWAYTSG